MSLGGPDGLAVTAFVVFCLRGGEESGEEVSFSATAEASFARMAEGDLAEIEVDLMNEDGDLAIGDVDFTKETALDGDLSGWCARGK